LLYDRSLALSLGTIVSAKLCFWIVRFAHFRNDYFCEALLYEQALCLLLDRLLLRSSAVGPGAAIAFKSLFSFFIG